MGLNIDIKGSFVNAKSLGLKKKLDEIRHVKTPSFASYVPDFVEMDKIAAKYREKRNIIVIGNGGSINNTVAIYEALKSSTTKTAHFVNTMEPDYLNEVRKHCPPDISLAVVVSKSGTTLSPIESMLYFDDYEKVAVTSDKGTLREFSLRTGTDFVEHPDIGGRFSGISESALVPSAILGFPVKEICRGAREMYSKCSPKKDIEKNPALQAAAVLYVLENKGFTEIFCPIYSMALYGFSGIIKQLMHESVCKNGVGQTVFCDVGPEVQHHSTQRFFGGRRNMAAVFVAVRSHAFGNEKIRVPKHLGDIKLRDKKLKCLDRLKLSRALEYELEGVIRHAKHEGIPYIKLVLNEVSPRTVGEFMAFWQYVAVYSSLLREVNPYDQPEVEYAKKSTFDMLKRRC